MDEIDAGRVNVMIHIGYWPRQSAWWRRVQWGIVTPALVILFIIELVWL